MGVCDCGLACGLRTATSLGHDGSEDSGDLETGRLYRHKRGTGMELGLSLARYCCFQVRTQGKPDRPQARRDFPHRLLSGAATGAGTLPGVYRMRCGTFLMRLAS